MDSELQTKLDNFLKEMKTYIKEQYFAPLTVSDNVLTRLNEKIIDDLKQYIEKNNISDVTNEIIIMILQRNKNELENAVADIALVGAKKIHECFKLTASLKDIIIKSNPPPNSDSTFGEQMVDDVTRALTNAVASANLEKYDTPEYNRLSADDKTNLRKKELQHINDELSPLIKRVIISPSSVECDTLTNALINIKNIWNEFRHTQLQNYIVKGEKKLLYPQPQSYYKQPLDTIWYLKDQMLAGNFVPFLRYLSNSETGGKVPIPSTQPPVQPEQLKKAFQGDPVALKESTNEISKWLGYGALATLLSGLLFYWGNLWYQERERNSAHSILEKLRLDIPTKGESRPLNIALQLQPGHEKKVWDTVFDLIGHIPTKNEFKQLKPGLRYVVLDLPEEIVINKVNTQLFADAFQDYMAKAGIKLGKGKLVKHGNIITILFGTKTEGEGPPKKTSQKRAVLEKTKSKQRRHKQR